MRNARSAALAALVSGGLLVAGCGSDDGGKALSKADLAKKADDVCVKQSKKLDDLKAPTDAKSALAYFDKALPIATELRDDLGKLKPDDKVKSEWNDVLANYDTQLTAVKKAITVLKSGDQQGFLKAGEEIDKLSKTSDKKLDALGAPHCGSQSDAA